MAVDLPAKRLFWGDGMLDYIGSCDYDGKNRLVVITKPVRHIFGLSVFEVSESTRKFSAFLFSFHGTLAPNGNWTLNSSPLNEQSVG